MSLLNASLSPEDQLHLLLGRLVHAVARLDLTVGLQLKWLGPYRSQDCPELFETGQGSFRKRLNKLKSLSLDTWGHVDAEARSAFSEWFARADAARGIRNDYAHGRWGRRSVQNDDFNFVALGWEMDPDKQPAEVVVRLDALAHEVGEIEHLTQDLLDLQERFSHAARPSHEWESANRRGVDLGADG